MVERTSQETARIAEEVGTLKARRRAVKPKIARLDELGNERLAEKSREQLAALNMRVQELIREVGTVRDLVRIHRGGVAEQTRRDMIHIRRVRSEIRRDIFDITRASRGVMDEDTEEQLLLRLAHPALQRPLGCAVCELARCEVDSERPLACA